MEFPNWNYKLFEHISNIWLFVEYQTDIDKSFETRTP